MLLALKYFRRKMLFKHWRFVKNTAIFAKFEHQIVFREKRHFSPTIGKNCRKLLL
jgi:hypothetical protein